MHDHAGRVPRGGIDLFQARKALLGELRPGPAADHLHPVRRRRAACLLANPPHALGERWHAIPAHFVGIDRKSTRLNSSHGYISYAVFCLKKKNMSAYTRITARLKISPNERLMAG